MNRPARLVTAVLTASAALLLTACGSGGGDDASSDNIGWPYELKALVTWAISWEGSGGAQGDLPDGAFEATRDMAVQEIQSVNR
ncbi:hypothetical protein [Streptomyces sp. B21-083]|uniref:hypothetical protein n=1 Tax=Streptomyces sp. B21-083 TaxID=3039410 RepID=UPI002FF08232